MSDHMPEIFHKSTERWFTSALGPPTEVQKQAWPEIAAGRHTLVSAPTGTGKTLTAFLIFIDRLLEEAGNCSLKQELRLIYISPLKSLAGDIRENLRRPLEGILKERIGEGASDGSHELQIGIRTGDTSQKERNRMIRKPPHILITTPESLYLMLTSQSGRNILKTAEAVIIDELHAVIDSKRGAHLMLSVARLDRLCGRSLQRIGLSATIEPLDIAARYLSPDPVSVIAPDMHKEIRISVTSPLGDQRSMRKDSIWQELAETVYSYCGGSGSAIAFVEGRAYAEKLAYFINQAGGEGFARTHHGSLSKEQRFEVEQALRSGSLRLLCATSSMELGIDVGDIDQVFQIGCPRSISSTMQRLGRAGHNPNRTSVMHMFPREAVEGLYCGLTAKVAKDGGIEYSNPPRLCFDILAQHLVSMACGEEYEVREVMELLPRAYPFQDVTEEEVGELLCMLAGDYEHERDIPARPRLIYDRLHNKVRGDAYSRMLAVSAGGTIPDRGLYAVRTEDGVRLGELDEEFVFESRIGDRFLLGTFAWQIIQILKDTVVVARTGGAGARLPFWHGDMKGRRLRTGIAFGEIFRRLSLADEAGGMLEELKGLGLDDRAAQSALEFLKRQKSSTGILPDDRTIVIEHFMDENSSHQMMVHSLFGRQVNEPLSLLAKEAAKHHTDTSINCAADDDGFLLFPYDGQPLPEGLLKEIWPEAAGQTVAALLPATPLYHMNFRYNMARALMMGARGSKRQPLWIQRMRSAEMLSFLIGQEKHPILRETKRECLEDYWDLKGVEYILNGIRSGDIRVREMYLDTPSPMSLPLRRQTEASMMYDYSPTTSTVRQAAEDSLKQISMVTPAPEQLARVSVRAKLPENEEQLHSLLMMEGDLIAGELDVPVAWLESLSLAGRVKYIEPGLWIAAEQEKEYSDALEEKLENAGKRLIQRVLKYRGAMSCEQAAERYLWPDEKACQLLSLLCAEGKVIEQEGIYYHSDLYNRARKETIKSRRRQVATLPAERYASLLTSRMRMAASPAVQLEEAIKALSGRRYPAEAWESILLPARVGNYRPELLDTLLSGGAFFWQLGAGSELCFHPAGDIDWEGDLPEVRDGLEGDERVIYEALLKYGASFMQRLEGLVEGSSFASLLGLAAKGLISADSFLPVRQWLNQDKLQKATARQRVNVRMKVLSAGRWEVIRPFKPLTVEEQLDRNFDRSPILCRETVRDISWSAALETLRIWEYTGRARRGYFIEGLSGIQFIREKDYAGTMQALEQPGNEILWLNAADPAQPWGKCLKHGSGRSFLNVAGTGVALRGGVPAAVLERQGRILRVFDPDSVEEVLHAFTRDFRGHRIFPSRNRIVVKDYPGEAAGALSSAGFIRELQDYVIYR
ncbi:DEAD/DEAH box helicase [Lachnospiraceae bacterium 54-53]